MHKNIVMCLLDRKVEHWLNACGDKKESTEHLQKIVQKKNLKSTVMVQFAEERWL